MMQKIGFLEGEEIIFRTRKHPIIFWSAILWTVIAIMFYVVIVPRFSVALATIPLATKNLLVEFFTAVPFLASGFFWISQGILYITSDFTITNKRLMMQEGFFIRHSTDTRLSTVAHVNVEQSLIGQALNYGTIVINNFGGSGDYFTQIANPKIFQNCVQQQLDKITR